MNEKPEFWEKNLSLLKRRSFIIPPDLSRPENAEVIEALNGSPVISVYGKLLHSGVDPEAEGKKIADRLNLDEGDHLLLYGFGLGYHIQPILEILGPSGKIIVIELNYEILARALFIRDLSSILLKPNFILISGGKSEYLVSKSLRENLSGSWGMAKEKSKRVAIFSPSYQFFPEGYESIKRAFDVQKMEKRFDAVLGDKAKSNLKKNSKYVLTSRKISEIYGSFKGYLGVLVGSGPSLDSAIRYLKYLPRKSFILAVDSSLAALVMNGIKVDALLSVDPQEAVYTHVGNMPEKEIPLFFVADSNHSLVRGHKGERFFISRGREGGENGTASVLGGGAVSCIGLELLIKFALNPILQIGIDSSFPGKRYYANHISPEMFDEITRLVTLSDVHKRRIEVEDMVAVKNFSGGETRSHLNLFSYLRSIENLAESNREVSICVPGASGAYMKRVLPMNPAHIICKRA